MNIGEKAPDYLGLNEAGREIRLSDFRGKKVVLYFYPKDMTSGCTAQACSLRDHYGELREAGYEVIGVSINDAKSHQKFIEKYMSACDGHSIERIAGIINRYIGGQRNE